MASPRGRFIIFEGADDLGKTTQIEKVYQHFLDKGMDVIKTREPGGTTTGSKIRNILLESKERVPKIAELLLFMADRNIHYHQVIKPHLDKGYTVLCDRFHLSTIVYQYHLKGNDKVLIDYIHAYAVLGLQPDMTFVFHGQRLTNYLKDAYEENLGDKSHEKLNKYYYEYGSHPDHYLINANKSQDEVFEELLSYME
jgi:dTMP kinase